MVFAQPLGSRPMASSKLNVCNINIESVLIAVTVKKRISFNFGRTLFWVFSFVHKIVLSGAFPRSKNLRAKNRAFWCSPSCQKSCFLVLSFVHCSPLSKHRALDRAFWCPRSRTKSCFLVLSLVPKIVLFGALPPRARNGALDRAFWCFPSCQKSLQLLGLCQHIYIYIVWVYVLTIPNV